MVHDCDPRQFSKFQRDYTCWMVNSFIGQQEPENSLYHDMMISRLDSTWQDRIKHMDRSSTKEALWTEMDRHMLSLQLMHNLPTPSKPIGEAGGFQKREMTQGLQAPVSQKNQVTDLILSQPTIEVAETTRKYQI